MVFYAIAIKTFSIANISVIKTASAMKKEKHSHHSQSPLATRDCPLRCAPWVLPPERKWNPGKLEVKRLWNDVKWDLNGSWWLICERSSLLRDGSYNEVDFFVSTDWALTFQSKFRPHDNILPCLRGPACTSPRPHCIKIWISDYPTSCV